MHQGWQAGYYRHPYARESMIKSPVPFQGTKCPISPTLFLDGTDAIMLSEETALGQYPVEAVGGDTKVAERVERKWFMLKNISPKQTKENGITDAVSAEAVDFANNIGAKYMVALTYYGFAARMIARYKGSVQSCHRYDPERKSRQPAPFNFRLQSGFDRKIEYSAKVP